MTRNLPPFSFFTIFTFGGFWLIRMPKENSSCSIIFLCVTGLAESNTIRIILQVLAVDMTWRPRPFPSAAPSIIPLCKRESCNELFRLFMKKEENNCDTNHPCHLPGRSRTWIRAPLYFIVPGIQVSVVNSYAAYKINNDHCFFETKISKYGLSYWQEQYHYSDLLLHFLYQ